MTQLIPVILSGGAGTRLWPASRQSHPKPFMALPDGDTLIGKTLRRALVLGSGDVITVTGQDHFLMTRDTYQQHPEAATGRMHYILEPTGRNTAPAAAVAALYAQRQWSNDAVILIMPADHIIDDLEAFGLAVQRAVSLAEQGYLVTFGIEPEHPETGYGYIRRGDALGDAGYAVDRFVEKPDLETARRYVDSGAYLWNSGIFCFPVGGLLEQLDRHAPEVLAAARACVEAGPLVSPLTLPEADFERAPGISIDYALMEKTERAAIVPCSIGWNDVGSWQAFSQLATADEHGNRLIGEALAIESEGCFVRASGRLITAVGVRDLAIIDDGDAVLVADLKRSQQVKKVVEALRSEDHPAATVHPVEVHEWGTAELVDEANGTRIRRLRMHAGSLLEEPDDSARTWTIVAGQVQVAGELQQASISSPAGHRATLEVLQDSILIEITLTA
ncbi:MAG: mannose-1-phosphate guanylyltransferase/mannose-6-phosphate isomerase [Xanthomonadales bacterium]|nr:mannose-1-phosphate guanylyltransferase/mannose-6-phosphate isomerase [Xanthomonadales bacterium]